MTINAVGAVPPIAESPSPDRRPDARNLTFEVPTVAVVSSQNISRTASGTPAALAARAMLALQEQTGLDGDPAADMPDREAQKHGQDILEALAELQRDLLAEGTPVRAISRLTTLAQMTSRSHDPALARILSAIRLRAQLEILRLARRSPERKTPSS